MPGYPKPERMTAADQLDAARHRLQRMAAAAKRAGATEGQNVLIADSLVQVEKQFDFLAALLKEITK